MEFSKQWLVQEGIALDASTKDIADRLTMAGLEVDQVHTLPYADDFLVVGHVLSVEPHPDADRLNVCQVEVGQEQPLQIVCGAKNVRANIKVPVAQVGAKLGADFKIKRAKLRGVESCGMICSEQELGLAEKSEGILILPKDAPCGARVRDYLYLDDDIIALDLTPDRGDCLSICGVARELSALYQQPMVVHPAVSIPAEFKTDVTVEVEDKAACPRYAIREVRNLDCSQPLPIEIKERLRRSGIRSVHPVVDILNYTMLWLGQPLHAFDYDRLADKQLQVRMSRSGETIGLLDGQSKTLSEGTLLVANANQLLAMAGIMGSEDSAVQSQTTRVVLESAHFTPQALAGQARSYQLSTDAAHRFERGVDPNLPVQALDYAAHLLVTYLGGQVSELVVNEQLDELGVSTPIQLRMSRLTRLLGFEMTRQQVFDILTSLHMQVHQQDEDTLSVTVPSYRFDLAIEADLIEELARIYGYDQIPVIKPMRGCQTYMRSESREHKNRLVEVLQQRGYFEAMTYSFIDQARYNIFSYGHDPLTLKNPISQDMAVMRSSLLPGLLKTVEHNHGHQQFDLRLFEKGRCFDYDQKADVLNEKMVLSGLICGHNQQGGLGAKKAVDFFDLKADVLALLSEVLDVSQLGFQADSPFDFMHPGQSAHMVYEGQVIGLIGALHPKLSQQFGLKRVVYVFELWLDQLPDYHMPQAQQIAKFPHSSRDLSVVIEQDIKASDLIDAVKQLSLEQVQEVQVIDVYQGDGLEDTKKSLTLNLIFQDLCHTLKDEQVNQMMDLIIKQLKECHGAILRK